MYTDYVVLGGVIVRRASEYPMSYFLLVDFGSVVFEHTVGQVQQEIAQPRRAVEVRTRFKATYQFTTRIYFDRAIGLRHNGRKLIYTVL